MRIPNEKLEAIFEAAVALETDAQRADFLNRACPDPELRREIESLLAAHHNPDSVFEKETIRVEVPTSEEVGTVIGRYKLLEALGVGGFGEVWLAEQKEPVRRKVALKVIKLGMDTKQVVARFEAERQALALMDHPNIAKVLDAGTTEQGRPYFVMELVRGITITKFCDENKLATRERLDIFMKVCHAVQHAHQKGIIHRDLKPSNVLVTLHDGVPVPKVIDFGIAKATQQELTDKTIHTLFQQFIGTPAYVSPEQAEMSGLDIDTRSDIYSLGVLLYELLTGFTPFNARTLMQSGLDEMRRIIREDEPKRPSTRLSTLEMAEATALTKHREEKLPALVNLLRGDLDWIVMKCLEKDRARRYDTANGLAMDLKRHLNNEPVVARPPSPAYRFQKLVRRNKLAFAAASVVTAALIVGLGVSTWAFIKEKAALRRAVASEREHDSLRQQAEYARQNAEARAYASDMVFAAQSADSAGSLGSVEQVLFHWRDSKPDLRGWEWFYLNGLCHRDRLTIRGDTERVSSVAWSPDGNRLASAGGGHTVKLWNAVTDHEILKLHGHADEVVAVAWHPDGKQLASASKDKTVRIWDTDTASEIVALSGHSDELRCLAWSPDGKKLASGSLDKTVKLWNAASGSEIRTLQSLAVVQSVSWNTNGTRLASADAGHFVKVWDVPTGRELLAVPLEGIRTGIAWSPDDKRLATGGHDSRVTILDAATGAIIQSMHQGAAVISVAWNSDGKRLASTSRGDGAVRIWDAATGETVQSFRGHRGAANSVSWRPNGTQVASAGSDGRIKIWDANHEDKFRKTLRQPGQGLVVAWHPDGNQLATGSSDGAVRIWESTRAEELAVLRGHTGWVWSVVWNSNGTLLASAGDDGVIKLWATSNALEAWSVQGHPKGVRALAWSPDGKRLASVSDSDSHLKVWDAATGSLSAKFDREARGGGLALNWSPDGTRLATWTAGGILVLDALSGKTRLTLRGHAEPSRSLAWSPEGKRLASASDDTTIRIWDMATGKELQTLIGHVSQVYSVAWNPDGTRLASGSWDRTLKIWNPVSGQQVCSLEGKGGALFCVDWSSDGGRIASSTIVGEIVIHDSTPGHIVERKHKLADSEGRRGKANRGRSHSKGE